ncbi:DUF6415 family natural product biosynthesis protein [Streptomyces sp. CGMCC 4.7035]|uniref:DUF6415 family natural product biosynthesis protein n=1 Tax=Streptomyces sp. CGMCC 4.7035 TaxID=3061628 RepID=UPI002872CD02|nr:DUF6415 family natural product biosynthesis protein [Streptomyces sp. CGMCC 4.7035]WNC00504.1 DUF6415 family natural product biosynthesis protein [Streptomyces sp. CGMCC 4.7035]
METNNDTRAPDIAMMRETINRLLTPTENTPHTSTELETLTGLLRGHMELLMPEVQAAAVKLPKDDVPRYCALACIGEARQRLAAEPSPVPGGDGAYARRLARSLAALCDHYETLTGVSMCLACDKPIKVGDESVPYDQVSPSGGGVGAGRVHARCVNALHCR